MPAARAHINITPLIDVMLVLLIICMLMPHTHHTLAAQVPAPPADAPDGTPPPPLVIVVGSSLALNGTLVEGLEELRQRLEIALAVRADRTVFVRSSGNPTYGRVVEAMDAARTAGAERLGLLTNGNQPPSSRSTRNP